MAIPDVRAQYFSSSAPTFSPTPTDMSPPMPSPTGPSYADIIRQVRQPITIANPTSGNAYYSRATETLSPDTNYNNPDTQKILAANEAQRKYLADQAIANATSLAAKRGITGSSTEQFGTQTALAQTNLASMNANNSVYAADAQRTQAARDLQAQILAQQGGAANTMEGNINVAQGQLQGQQNIAAGQLTSDELASLRNQDYARQYLQLQQTLGQQGIDIARENIGAQRDIGEQQGRNNLIGSAIGAGTNLGTAYLMSRGFGNGTAGGGGMVNPLTGGGYGASGFGVGGVPYAGGASGTASSSLFPGGIGPVGTAQTPGMFGAGGTLFNTAGTSTLGAGNILPGVAGWQAGTQAFGDNRYTNIGGIAGGIGGSLFGPLGSAAGGFLGAGAGKAYAGLNDTGKALVNPFANPGATVKAVSSGVKQVANKVGDALSSIPF